MTSLHFRAKDLWMPLYCFENFCKASDGAFNATKIVQIDEGLNKICVLQVKGVMGTWVGIYDQFVFWSLRFLNITLLSLHFNKVCKASNNTSITF
jgi:hypothetical protein